VKKYCRAGQTTGDSITRRMRILSWITEATDTHTHTLTHTHTHTHSHTHTYTHTHTLTHKHTLTHTHSHTLTHTHTQNTVYLELLFFHGNDGYAKAH
jgi:hypothetical protein